MGQRSGKLRLNFLPNHQSRAPTLETRYFDILKGGEREVERGHYFQGKTQMKCERGKKVIEMRWMVMGKVIEKVKW